MTAVDGMRIDDNLVLRDGSLSCVHCGTLAGRAGEPFLSAALLIESVPGAAGPQVRDNASEFIDSKVVFRQRICAGCTVALQTEVVPEQDVEMRTKEISS